MVKEKLIQLIQDNVPDGEEIAVSTLWFRNDIPDWAGQALDDAQWERFCYWFDKYQDSSYDTDEALNYALKEG